MEFFFSFIFIFHPQKIVLFLGLIENCEEMSHLLLFRAKRLQFFFRRVGMSHFFGVSHIFGHFHLLCFEALEANCPLHPPPARGFSRLDSHNLGVMDGFDQMCKKNYGTDWKEELFSASSC